MIKNCVLYTFMVYSVFLEAAEDSVPLSISIPQVLSVAWNSDNIYVVTSYDGTNYNGQANTSLNVSSNIEFDLHITAAIDAGSWQDSTLWVKYGSEQEKIISSDSTFVYKIINKHSLTAFTQFNFQYIYSSLNSSSRSATIIATLYDSN